MKTILRYLCPALAGIVAFVLGEYGAYAVPMPSFAELTQTCTPAHYTEYTNALHNPDMEGSPQDLLAISEAFLIGCPDRPEAPRVSLDAARHALDSGLGQRALLHFENARKAGAYFPHQSRMDYISALVINAQPQPAWRIRDREVAQWLETARDQGLATIHATRLRDGLVYKLTFDAVDPSRRVRIAWMAVPFGAGFPATLSLEADAQIMALMHLSRGAAATDMEQLVLNRCHGRKTLTTSLTGLDDIATETQAMAIAKAYLERPDEVGSSAAGKPIATCFNTERVFIAPDPQTAVPVY